MTLDITLRKRDHGHKLHTAHETDKSFREQYRG